MPATRSRAILFAATFWLVFAQVLGVGLGPGLPWLF